MNVTIIEQERFFKIIFPFSPFVVKKIKEIEGRRFIKEGSSGFWIVPIDQKEQVFHFAKTVKGKIVPSDHSFEDVSKVPEISPFPSLDIKIPLSVNPYPYQFEGIAYGIKHRRFLNGDQQGLGKTLQTIGTLEGIQVTDHSAFPCLIICPSSLKINWSDEVKKWTGKEAVILHDKIKHTFHHFSKVSGSEYFITNFESLKKYFVESIKKPKGVKTLQLKHIAFKDLINHFQTVIIDESHRIKDSGTQTAKFVKGITHGKKNIILLSGTPVINKPKDLISQLAIMERLTEIGGLSHFNDRYCSGPKQASNLTELNAVLSNTCFFRRTKQQVLTDLPEKTRSVIRCEIDTADEYQIAKEDLKRYLKEFKNASDSDIIRSLRSKIIVQIGILKAISAKGKVNSMIEIVKNHIESGEKLVLFAHLKEVVSKLKEAFPEAVTITGSDSESQKDQAKKRFQEDPECKLIICSIKSAGVGLTLTASSTVAFIELAWTFADCEQCEDRVHRIGQKENVTALYLLGKGTIDEKIYQIILEKKDISRQITGTKDIIEEDETSFDSFIRSLTDEI